ncbi:MAG TPA: hypothetical protein VMU99_06530 [Acidimicrobiales bacterium]|nr:hypothetical protein [Acidimicrobiales bacterium]
MGDKGLSLKELRVRVEATFDWPGHLDDTSPISIPEATDEIGQQLRAIEQRLSPAPPQSEQESQLASSLLSQGPALEPLANEEMTEEMTEVDRRLGLLEQRVVETSATALDLTEFFDRLEELEERLSAVAAPDAQLAEETTSRLRELEAQLTQQSLVTEDVTEVHKRLALLEQRVVEPLATTRDVTEFLDHLKELEERLSAVAAPDAQLAEETTSRLRELETQLAQQSHVTEEVSEVDRRLALREQRVVEPSATALDLAEFFDRLQILEERLSAMAGVDAHLTEVPFAQPEPTSAPYETRERPLSISTNGREADAGSYISGGDHAEMIDILRGDTEPEETVLAGRFFKKKRR